MKFTPTWSLEHFLRLLAAVLDASGVILIAVAVIEIEKRQLVGTSVEDLEEELNSERNSEGKWSMVGVVLIAIGFICLLIAEIVSWVKFSTKAGPPRQGEAASAPKLR